MADCPGCGCPVASGFAFCPRCGQKQPVACAGCGFVCGGFWTGSVTWIDVGAWLFVFGACFAWYTGAMLLLEYAWGRVILPFGIVPGLMKPPVLANRPGARISRPVEYALGQPGTRHGT